ncbi:unnamed protein product [Tilletia controversa]|uniref:RING-type domain-containing protein n=2 Tax=Tilletia TaxID=13289 RepID=A0A9N8LEP0_9BASI|nr:hypothetical protein CF336_g2504 [Tilletia laevis]CAD6890211.1 unnamed protein product [Tilletia caries]CAD6902535.1 unnamed protein product [Tilletia controversa]KAE8206309.1 hypothetical protein CF335_g1985 [Tilletia laevis]CAD6907168.1 unnamed protein product [Tilletia laevis]
MGQASGKHTAHDEPMVDGGALVPQGVYTAAQDYDHTIVQRCIHERKLAPFYKFFDDDQPDAQSIADAYPHLSQSLHSLQHQHQPASPSSHARSASASSASASASPSSSSSPSSPLRSGADSPSHYHPQSPPPPPPPTSLLPHPLTECPICFLYYPSPLNFTRCCEQPICTECFVQIKRADPNHTNPPSSEPATCPYCMEANFGVVYRPPPSLLVKGPGAGAGTGTVGAGHGASAAVAAAGNMASTIGAAATGTIANARRRKSFGHTDPEVITIDMIRPDWEDKLRQAHAAIARRANRRIIMRQVGDRLIPIGVSSSRAGAELPEGLIQGPGGAIIITTTGAAVVGAGNGQQQTIGSGSGRWNIGTAGAGNVVLPGDASGGGRGGSSGAAASSSAAIQGDSALQTPPRTERGSSRSTRRRNQELAYLQALGGQELEEVMMMEAMRLSLLEHEEQQQRQAEAARREQSATTAAAASAAAAALASARDAPSDSNPTTSTSDGSRDTTSASTPAHVHAAGTGTEAAVTEHAGATTSGAAAGHREPSTTSETLESDLQEAQREVRGGGGGGGSSA